MERYDITCTLGTTTDDPAVLYSMSRAGMTGVRLNTAYGSFSAYSDRITKARSLGAKTMLDIKGPQVRLGDSEPVAITGGSELFIGYPGSGSPLEFSKELHGMEVGGRLLIENGTISTEVIGAQEDGLRLRVHDPGDGWVKKRMGVNVPGTYLDVARLSPHDRQVISYGLAMGVDQIALSFCRDREDLAHCYDHIKSVAPDHKREGGLPEIVAKIEDGFGVKNIDDIIAYAKHERMNFSVMLGRGDLAVELGVDEVPYAQSEVVRACRRQGVDVMVGTGILSSMQQGLPPTRAEACDVYNMLRGGVTSFMLSGETSFSRNPVGAVATLRRMIDRYEAEKAKK